MESILCLCVLLVGLHAVVQPHHVPDHHNDQDGQTDINPPQQLTSVGGNVVTEIMTFLKLAPSNADFAFRFYKQIKSEAADKNIFFSPLSISTAFAMLTLGAKSTTLSQIHKGLCFNPTEIEEREIHEGFHHLIHMLNRPDSEIQLNIGNALFVDDQLTLLEKFLAEVKSLYESETFPSNFQNFAVAEKQINDYIQKKTHGKIANLVKEINLYFPAFSVSGTSDVKDLFEKMSVIDVFTDEADLSGITEKAKLKVSKVVHKTLMDVHENGTEAAAITVMEIIQLSDTFPPPPPIKFNRPFLMMILEKPTQRILFMGRIINPTEK
ncbi:alpha-1-antitrypsin-like [Gopherus flavomarginatus]|uniref:alpha-1-antitrypsin-like n=1 Tax=Gopherus flavomarginatus TaxID=286002 RepID=UPI0021CB9F92|nr:alpha-1-antitrypsin-like [Gopherus flavomarginatus]